MKKRRLLLAGIALSGLLHAQPVRYRLSVDRDHVQTQQPVKNVLYLEAASRWRGLRVDLGVGDVRELLGSGLLVSLTRQYLALGRDVLRLQCRLVPGGITSVLGCGDSARALTFTVGEGGKERQKRDAEIAREQQKHGAELDRERGKQEREPPRQREDRRESPNRDRGVVNVPAPVPGETPPRNPAPAANKPRDVTLRVF